MTRRIYIALMHWLFPCLLFLFFNFIFSSLENVILYSISMSILVFFYYIFIFYMSVKNWTGHAKYDMALIPLIYIMVLILLALLFSIILLETNTLLGSSTDDVSMFELFYFCIISLTSVGYGDISPITVAEKVVAITMSLVGSLHMIIFISVMIENRKKLQD